jgi:hypothetical protein
LSSTNHGEYAGESVATVRVPGFCVCSCPGLQAELPELPPAPLGWGEAGPDEALPLATIDPPPPAETEPALDAELPDEQDETTTARAAVKARTVGVPARVTAPPSVMGGLASAGV